MNKEQLQKEAEKIVKDNTRTLFRLYLDKSLPKSIHSRKCFYVGDLEEMDSELSGACRLESRVRGLSVEWEDIDLIDGLFIDYVTKGIKYFLFSTKEKALHALDIAIPLQRKQLELELILEENNETTEEY